MTNPSYPCPLRKEPLLETISRRSLPLLLGVCCLLLASQAQPRPAAGAAATAAPAAGGRGGGGPQGPQVVSPEVGTDRKVTFRILAPKAQIVRLSAGDIPGNGQGKEMVRSTNGVWEVTLGPMDPGAYRYQFNVDGVNVIDPRSPAVSESNNNVWSLVSVPGSDFMDTTSVPHGAVSVVNYYSKALQKSRRMHIYTPPGYESGKGKYPVFYLLHGAGDCDDSWTSVGRAGFILDNLIAAKKARPMIVAMPAGHTRSTMSGGGRGAAATPGAPGQRAVNPTDEFVQDFLTDILPYVEKNYRAIPDRKHRAIAGLSMGGNQTLNIALPHLEMFSYVGVYSSGLFGGGPGGGRGGANTNAVAAPTWEQQHLAELDNPKYKKGLEVLWFATGKDDFLLNTTKSTVEMLKKHGFNPVFKETEGAHTWIVWRNYLNEFAPMLFGSAK